MTPSRGLQPAQASWQRRHRGRPGPAGRWTATSRLPACGRRDATSMPAAGWTPDTRGLLLAFLIEAGRPAGKGISPGNRMPARWTATSMPAASWTPDTRGLLLAFLHDGRQAGVTPSRGLQPAQTSWQRRHPARPPPCHRIANGNRRCRHPTLDYRSIVIFAIFPRFTPFLACFSRFWDFD